MLKVPTHKILRDTIMDFSPNSSLSSVFESNTCSLVSPAINAHDSHIGNGTGPGFSQQSFMNMPGYDTLFHYWQQNQRNTSRSIGVQVNAIDIDAEGVHHKDYFTAGTYAYSLLNVSILYFTLSLIVKSSIL